MKSLLTRGWNRMRRELAQATLGVPRRDQAGLFSMLYPDMGRPNERLLDLMRDVVPLAAAEDLSEISARITSGPRWPDVWPGEHYRLLAALVRLLGAKRVVEIGSYQGLGALTLARNLSPGGTVHTFDVVPWREVPGSILRDTDFADGRIVQILDDVTWPAGFARHAAIFEAADLVFIDAEKDGQMERRLIDRLNSCRLAGPIVVFDDIRLWNMLDIWPRIERPKIDATSIGHYTGTGIVDWTA